MPIKETHFIKFEIEGKVTVGELLDVLNRYPKDTVFKVMDEDESSLDMLEIRISKEGISLVTQY